MPAHESERSRCLPISQVVNGLGAELVVTGAMVKLVQLTGLPPSLRHHSTRRAPELNTTRSTRPSSSIGAMLSPSYLPDPEEAVTSTRAGTLAALSSEVHTAAPGPLERPGGQATGSVAPRGHANPGGHCPVQDAFVMVDVAPYLPAGQGAQAPNPPGLNRPAGHTATVAFWLLAGQEYPAAQAPLHPAVGIATALPNRPGGQSRHTGSSTLLYDHPGHAIAVLFKLPGGHQYPGVHGPLQADELAPGVLP
jgi:hypothetical protein